MGVFRSIFEILENTREIKRTQERHADEVRRVLADHEKRISALEQAMVKKSRTRKEAAR